MKLFDSVREIPITDLEGLRIGNAQDYEAMTGVTVLLFDHGAKAGIEYSGRWAWLPGKLHLTSPITADNPAQCHCTLPAALPSAWLPVTESCAIWKNTVLVMKPDLRRFR